MVEQTGDELAGHRGEPVLVVLVDEGVALALPQRDVRVHARTLHSTQRLGHEAGVDAIPARHLLDHHARRHHGVGHGEGIGVAQVDLVLAARVFMLGVLDRDPHFLEHQDRTPSEVAGGVSHAEVEVRARIECPGRVAGIRVGEVEVLDLRGGEKGVPGRAGPLEGPSQRMTRITFEGCAVQVGDVAEDPGHRRVVVVPRQQLERLGVGSGQDVSFLHPAEAVDGGAVEGHPLVEGILQFGRGDVESLGSPEHIGKPQLDEPDASFLDGTEHVVALALHSLSFAGAGPPPPIRVHFITLQAWTWHPRSPRNCCRSHPGRPV